MIIPELINYFDRIEGDPAGGIAPFGWSRQKVAFKVVIEPDGAFVAVQDARIEETIGKKTYAKPALLTVPGQSKPSGSGINPGFLWDNASYMLGLLVEAKDSGKKADTARVRRSFEAFRERHLALESKVGDEHFSAVCRFLRSWDPAAHAAEAEALAALGTYFGVFEIRGQVGFVHERPRVKAYWNATLDGSSSDDDRPPVAPSLISGEPQPLARLHEPKIKGVGGAQAARAQAAGAAIVSFNRSAFESYGKSQSYNAPIGVRDAFRYCTALNHLLEQRSRKVSIGDDTFVFWAECPVPMEGLFEGFFGDAAPEEPGRAEKIREVLDRLRQGLDTSRELGESGTAFFILGLSPNAARLQVRFWLKSTVGDLAERLGEHHAALGLDGAPEGYRIPSIRDIVGETLPLKDGRPDHEKADKGLVAAVTRAVLTGAPYPDRLLAGVIGRVRAEGFVDSDKRLYAEHARHRRASIIKAILNRNEGANMDIAVNCIHSDKAYHCGRLLATVDFAQLKAMEKVNSTVVRRNLGGIMSSPGLVLPRILKTAEVAYFPKLHPDPPKRLGDLEQFVRDEVRAIACQLGDTLPTSLDLRQQGVFLLGFYQQSDALEDIGRQVDRDRRFRTKRGEWVASRGEVRVADCLLKIGVSYAYEPRVMLAEGPDRYPDFVVFGATKASTVFIEYVGGARNDDQADYNDRWTIKHAQYLKTDITPEGGANGRLIVIDARERTWDDASILHAIAPALGKANALPEQSDDE